MYKYVVIWDPTKRRVVVQARESLEQGCRATAQVGLLGTHRFRLKQHVVNFGNGTGLW
jgi:hypothetical protein